MRPPKPGMLPDRICRFIVECGPQTVKQLQGEFHRSNYNTLISAVHQLKHYGCIEGQDGVYSVTDALRVHYGLLVIPTEPEEPKPVVDTFRPWSGKYSIANLPLREPIRDICFHS